MFHVFRYSAYLDIEYMPSMWLWLSFRFLVHLVSWTNGVVGTVECAFVWEGGGWGVGVMVELVVV